MIILLLRILLDFWVDLRHNQGLMLRGKQLTVMGELLT